MKKLLCLLTFAIGLMPLASKAQTFKINGPEVEASENSVSYVLEDNDDYMRFFSQKITWSFDDAVITKYNKQTREVTIQAVDDDYNGRFVFLTDDNTTVNVVRYVLNKKTQMMEYQKASFPVDVKVPKKLAFTPFFSSISDKNITYYARAVFNADKSKFAIVFTTFPERKKTQSIIDVAVFDNTANLLYHESKVIERVYRSMFDNTANSLYRDASVVERLYSMYYKEDISMALDGTVYIVWSNYEDFYRSYNNGIQIITCSEHGIFDYEETPEPEASVNYKQVLKPNGDLYVMGFWSKEGDKEYKLRTYTVSSDGEVSYVEQDVALSADFEGGSYNDGPLANQKGTFHPYVFDLIRLQNGNFLMVGEMKKKVQVGTQGDNHYPLYGSLSHNLFSMILDQEGNVKETNVFPRMTVTCEELTKWKDAKSDPVCAFERDGDVYMIYNDHRDNYKGDGNVHCLLFNLPDQCSVVLSKIESNGELSSTVLYNAKSKIWDPQLTARLYNHECFLKLLHSTDDGVYYLLNRDDECHLEKIDF